MEVNVLGTTYKIILKAYKDDGAFEKKSIDGYCNGFTKEIIVCDLNTKEDWKTETKETIDICQRQILRHEIVHAFLDESGLQASAHNNGCSWAYNEEMVDWIALQGVKIYNAWKQAGCI